jgi:hypothetical protein
LQARIVCCIKFRLIESFQGDRHTDNHAAAMRSSPKEFACSFAGASKEEFNANPRCDRG